MKLTEGCQASRNSPWHLVFPWSLVQTASKLNPSPSWSLWTNRSEIGSYHLVANLCSCILAARFLPLWPMYHLPQSWYLILKTTFFLPPVSVFFFRLPNEPSRSLLGSYATVMPCASSNLALPSGTFLLRGAPVWRWILPVHLPPFSIRWRFFLWSFLGSRFVETSWIGSSLPLFIVPLSCNGFAPLNSTREPNIL